MSEPTPSTLLPTGLRIEGPPRVRAVWAGGAAECPLAPVVEIGRDPGCHLVVADRSVSRRHARLHLDGAPRIEDLGSTAGTFVAGERVAAGAAVAVTPGALVVVGAALLVVPLLAPPTAPGADDLLPRVAASDITVLVQGETGAGKEVLARTLHARSPRARGPFVAVNCAALPEQLVESELFGHERGAFTGADRPRRGLVEAADGGTLFLDEIGEMPAAAQAKLLRVLDRREVVPVGAVTPRRVDVRVIAATHRDLVAAAAAGTFREDLYWRLAGVGMRVPPLRERGDELPALVAALLAELAPAGPPTVSPAALAALRAHPWPGNVRELKNVLHRALLFARATVEPEHLGLPAPGAAPSAALTLREEVAELERRRILEALSATGGNQTRAAERLGIPLRTLVERLDAYGIARPRRRR